MLLRKVVKAMVVAFAAGLVVLSLTTLVYEASFEGNYDQILLFIKKAHPEDRSPPKTIKDVINIYHKGWFHPKTAPIAKSLLIKFAIPAKQSFIPWKLRYFLWDLNIRIRFSEDEILGLYCASIYNGEEAGLNNLSLRLYLKPMSLLSTEEATRLFVIAIAPSVFLNHPEELERLKSKLIEKMPLP